MSEAVRQGRRQRQRPRQREVTAQDGEGVAVGGVDGGEATAQVRAVDDVVVKQGGAVDDLDDGGELDGDADVDVEDGGQGAADVGPGPLGAGGKDEAAGPLLEAALGADDVAEAPLNASQEGVGRAVWDHESL